MKICERYGIVFSEYQPLEASNMGHNKTIWGKLGKTALVVVGLGVVLGVIFYTIVLPNFVRHGLGKDPPREAKTNLGSLFTSQITYFGEEDTYASSIENLG